MARKFLGKWGDGEMGKWGDGGIQLKPQHPNTLTPIFNF
jgi:hypothetical protein